jgi:hypothetical protein
LFSAALAVVMLLGLVPTALAASYDDSGVFDKNLICDIYYDLTNDTVVSLYNRYYYFIVTSDASNSPGAYVYSGSRAVSVEDVVLSDGSDAGYCDIRDVYIDADDTSTTYRDAYYDYTVYAYSTEAAAKADAGVKKTGYATYATIRVYTDSSYSGYWDGDVYAATDSYGQVDLTDLAGQIYTYANNAMRTDYPSYIQFTSVKNGALYYTSGNTAVGTSDKIDFYGTDDLTYGVYFQITDSAAVASISFRVTGDGRGSSSSPETVTGTIVINGEEEATISYKTDYNTSVYFDADDFEDLLLNNYSIDYVKFTSLPSSSEGALTLNGSTITRNTEVEGDDLDQVCFTPASTLSDKTVTVAFTLRMVKSGNVTSPRTVSGTIAIAVGKGGVITYRTEMDKSFYLDGDDFYDAFTQMVGQDSLKYVKFSDLPAKSKGVLYVVGSKSDSAVTTSGEFYYNDSEEKAISDVYFDPAANFTGKVTFTYDAYGSKSRYHMQGEVTITVIAGVLNDVTYSASKGAVALDAGDFDDLSYITFDKLPDASQGVLYYNYSASKTNNTKVNTTTQYKTTGKTGSLIANVTFVPADGITGTVTIPYTGYDTKGNMYTGSIVITTFVPQDTVITYTSTGLNTPFSVADFQNACLLKQNAQLASVRFSLPDASQGKLYYGYGTVQQSAASNSALYTVDTYLQYISFLPKEGFSGTATISYTGIDVNGAGYTGTIRVTVTPPTTSTYFTDVTTSSTSWLAPSVDFLYANGVYDNVVSGSTLELDTPVTRGEVMQMIYNAFDLESQVSSVTSNFTDVPASHPNYTAINAAYQLGITTGIGNGKFAPDDLITREDACTLLYRAFEKLGLSVTEGTASDLLSFPDCTKVDSWAVNGVASMIKSGIIGGDQNGNINPRNNLARGDVSVILHRAMTL